MATLYITGTGFRFPYNKWTDGSTNANLQFLEAQLGEYLHSHEDDGTTLWVTPQGFRMPYKKTRDNLEENMKYVEVQLEKYLHNHETAPGDNEELLTDGDLEALTSLEDTQDGTFQEVMENRAFDRASLSTANPRGGSKHVRVELDELSGNIYYGPNEMFTNKGESFERSFPYVPVSVGDELTASWWGYVHSGFETPVLRWRATAVELDGNLDQTNSFSLASNDISLTTDSYQEVSFTITIQDDHPFDPDGVRFWVQTGTTVNGNTTRIDLDDFSIQGPPSIDTLYTRPSGFRFPYDWEKDGDININMKFLETEISKYLHKHEVGV